MVDPGAKKDNNQPNPPVLSGRGDCSKMMSQLMPTATKARDGNTASRGNNTLILSGSFCRVAHPVARHVARNNAANVCRVDTYTFHGQNSCCAKPGTSNIMIPKIPTALV